MLLFENAEYARIFNPFCCRNNKIYYECMVQLIEKSKTVPVLYESDARDTLLLYLRNSKYTLQDENNADAAEEGISSQNTLAENASAILRYFRHCSWVGERELGRNGDNKAEVDPHCCKLIEAIERIFNRNTSGALTNHIFAMYELLRAALEKDNVRTIRPYSNILVPLTDNVADLKIELRNLNFSIRIIMAGVIKTTELNAFGQLLRKDEVLKRFFDDYFFIKKDGTIPSYIAEIEKMLRLIQQADIYEKMIKEYQELFQLEALTARQQIEAQFMAVQSFVSYDYDKEIGYIDKKINNYYNLYNTRMLLVLNNGANIQSMLNNFLLTLQKLNESAKHEALEQLQEAFGLQSYKYIGRRSLQRRRKRNPNAARGALATSTLTDEERRRLTQELLQENQDRYSVQAASKYFDQLLGPTRSLKLLAPMLQTRDDAMMLAACIIYSGSGDFPFAVEFLDGMLETEIACVSNIRIKRIGK